MARTAVAEELAAMRKIVGILDKLDTDVRERVIAWAHDRYNSIAATPSMTDAPLVDENEDDDDDGQDVHTSAPVMPDDNPFSTTVN